MQVKIEKASLKQGTKLSLKRTQKIKYDYLENFCLTKESRRQYIQYMWLKITQKPRKETERANIKDKQMTNKHIRMQSLYESNDISSNCPSSVAKTQADKGMRK